MEWYSKEAFSSLSDPVGHPMKESIPLRRSCTAALSGSASGVKRLPRG